MIPLNFYRDDDYVYYNNPNGITKKMTIADFEAVFDADSSELPSYTSSDGGKVLTVNSGGTGLEWGEVSGDIQIRFTDNISETTTIIPISYNEIKNAVLSGKAVRLVQPYEEDDSEYYTVYTLSSFENDSGTYYAYFIYGSNLATILSDDPDADMHGEG